MSASPYLAITTHHSGRRSVLRLQGELDVCTSDRLRHAINSALKHCPQLLVLDLSALGFMDCSGLSVLVWARKRLAEQERQFLITGAQPIVERLMHLTGLDRYLHLSKPEPRCMQQHAGTKEPACTQESTPAGEPGAAHAEQ